MLFWIFRWFRNSYILNLKFIKQIDSNSQKLSCQLLLYLTIANLYLLSTYILDLSNFSFKILLISTMSNQKYIIILFVKRKRPSRYHSIYLIYLRYYHIPSSFQVQSIQLIPTFSDGSGPKKSGSGRARALKVGLGPGPGLSPSLKAGLRAGPGLGPLPT